MNISWQSYLRGIRVRWTVSVCTVLACICLTVDGQKTMAKTVQTAGKLVIHYRFQYISWAATVPVPLIFLLMAHFFHRLHWHLQVSVRHRIQLNTFLTGFLKKSINYNPIFFLLCEIIAEHYKEIKDIKIFTSWTISLVCATVFFFSKRFSVFATLMLFVRNLC